MPKQTVYILALRRGAADEYREHFAGSCRRRKSARCKMAKRMSRKIAADHIRLHGTAYYPARQTKKHFLRGRGGCPGGCM